MPYGLNISTTRSRAEPLDGDIKAVRLVDDTPDGGHLVDQWYSGRAVRTEQLPTRMRWLPIRGETIPDFQNSLIRNVSSRAKEVIERLEPGVHQFVPVDYVGKGDKLIEKRWFLIVCNRVDGVSATHNEGMLLSPYFWRPAKDVARRKPELVPPGFDLTVPPRLVFSAAQIGSAHMWCDKHLSMGVFISDELKAAFDEAGLTGIEPKPVGTVSDEAGGPPSEARKGLLKRFFS